MRNKFELCIESYEGAKIAEKAGVFSIEINSGLDLGGLTPSLALVREICNDFKSVEKNIMIRPRPAGFIYNEYEYSIMLKDLEIFLYEDINGIVFGFLNEELSIDEKRTKEFVDIIHSKGKKAIFHRAFDNVKDYKKSIETLIELKVDRVLTSGQRASCIEGQEIIKELQNDYGKNIEILAGAGISSGNIKDFMNYTKVNYVHGSCRKKAVDKSTVTNVSYEISKGSGNYYNINDEKELMNIVAKLEEIGL